jgi:hypothetical protein
MVSTLGPAASVREPGVHLPWFRRRPDLAVGIAAMLFVAVFALRMTSDDAVSSVNLLYTFPIALLSLAFGRRVGFAAGAAAVVLVIVWAAARGVDLGVLGWVSRLVPLVLLGWLLGDASDRLIAAEEERSRLEAAAQRHRDATEVNDTLVQGMAAAKWALEAGRHEAALRTLQQTIELGHELVSKLMREGDMGPQGEHRPPEQSLR